MKIAIIAAMEPEVAILKSKINNCRIENIQGFEFYSGQIQGCEVVLLQSGIGKVAAASATTLLLSRYQVEAVINTGSAGGIDNRLNIGDVVVSTQTLYHDVNLTPFGYKPGQMAGCPITFVADDALRTKAKQAIKAQGVHAVEGIIASGDSFINGEQSLATIKAQFPETIAVEMEAAAIAHVCWLFSVPFIVVRAISDNGDQASAVNFDEFLPLAAKQSSLIVENMLNDLSQVS